MCEVLPHGFWPQGLYKKIVRTRHLVVFLHGLYFGTYWHVSVMSSSPDFSSMVYCYRSEERRGGNEC